MQQQTYEAKMAMSNKPYSLIEIGLRFTAATLLLMLISSNNAPASANAPRQTYVQQRVVQPYHPQVIYRQPVVQIRARPMIQPSRTTVVRPTISTASISRARPASNITRSSQARPTPNISRAPQTRSTLNISRGSQGRSTSNISHSSQERPTRQFGNSSPGKPAKTHGITANAAKLGSERKSSNSSSVRPGTSDEAVKQNARALKQQQHLNNQEATQEQAAEKRLEKQQLKETQRAQRPLQNNQVKASEEKITDQTQKREAQNQLKELKQEQSAERKIESEQHTSQKEQAERTKAEAKKERVTNQSQAAMQKEMKQEDALEKKAERAQQKEQTAQQKNLEKEQQEELKLEAKKESEFERSGRMGQEESRHRTASGSSSSDERHQKPLFSAPGPGNLRLPLLSRMPGLYNPQNQLPGGGKFKPLNSAETGRKTSAKSGKGTQPDGSLTTKANGDTSKPKSATNPQKSTSNKTASSASANRSKARMKDEDDPDDGSGDGGGDTGDQGGSTASGGDQSAGGEQPVVAPAAPMPYPESEPAPVDNPPAAEPTISAPVVAPAAPMPEPESAPAPVVNPSAATVPASVPVAGPAPTPMVSAPVSTSSQSNYFTAPNTVPAQNFNSYVNSWQPSIGGGATISTSGSMSPSNVGSTYNYTPAMRAQAFANLSKLAVGGLGAFATCSEATALYGMAPYTGGTSLFPAAAAGYSCLNNLSQAGSGASGLVNMPTAQGYFDRFGDAINPGGIGNGVTNDTIDIPNAGAEGTMMDTYTSGAENGGSTEAPSNNATPSSNTLNLTP